MLLASLVAVCMLAILGFAIVWTMREVKRVNNAMTVLQARIERAYGLDFVSDNDSGVYKLSPQGFGLLK